MNTAHTVAVVMFAGCAVLSGCSSTPTNTSTPIYETSPLASSAQYGSIESIQVARADGQASGAGAVIGGVVGALAGSQIGSGSGRTAATVAGAVGGAAAGHAIESSRNQQTADMYQINIRLDNGELRSVMQDSVYDLRVGNRVRVVDGRVYRY